MITIDIGVFVITVISVFYLGALTGAILEDTVTDTSEKKNDIE